MSSTIEEWLAAAEYILAQGNGQVVLCERGIRTFESATRNTLNLSAVVVLRERTHLPIIVDPSHGTGRRAYVAPMAWAARACGAHGVCIEVHPDPDKALSDGDQSLDLPRIRVADGRPWPRARLARGKTFNTEHAENRSARILIRTTLPLCHTSPRIVSRSARVATKASCSASCPRPRTRLWSPRLGSARHPSRSSFRRGRRRRNGWPVPG